MADLEKIKHARSGTACRPPVFTQAKHANPTAAQAIFRRVERGLSDLSVAVSFFLGQHCRYEHVQNNGGAVTDSFHIVQSKHGPFADMK